MFFFEDDLKGVKKNDILNLSKDGYFKMYTPPVSYENLMPTSSMLRSIIANISTQIFLTNIPV